MTSRRSSVINERLVDTAPSYALASHRPTAALRRATLARASLAECRLCAHRCGVDRLAGELGICRAGPTARVFCAQVETGDELELVPTFAIALSGCDLRCEFCVTASSSWNPHAGEPVSAFEIARRAERALSNGARTVMFLGGEPTIHLPTAIEIVAALPADAKVVWKTNAHASNESFDLLEGMVDVWLADYKFGNDNCARALAKTERYTEIVQRNLRWADQHSELIVRHLLMPGHLECCWRPVAQWLASELPRVKVSLRSAFWPMAGPLLHPELRRTVSSAENRRALNLANEFRLNLVP